MLNIYILFSFVFKRQKYVIGDFMVVVNGSFITMVKGLVSGAKLYIQIADCQGEPMQFPPLALIACKTQAGVLILQCAMRTELIWTEYLELVMLNARQTLSEVLAVTFLPQPPHCWGFRPRLHPQSDKGFVIGSGIVSFCFLVFAF